MKIKATTPPVEETIQGYITAKLLVGERNGDDDHAALRGVARLLATLHLVAFVEDRYGIRVADGELSPENFASIARLAAYVQRKSARLP